MAVEKRADEPSLAPTVHALAKPVTRTAAWSLVAAATGALALAARRTWRTGE